MPNSWERQTQNGVRSSSRRGHDFLFGYNVLDPYVEDDELPKLLRRERKEWLEVLAKHYPEFYEEFSPEE